MLPPKVNRCETEYRRSFRKSQFNCSSTTYQKNLDFRLEQKKRFVEHNQEPFDWDPEDIESDSSSDYSCDDLNKPSRLTHTQYKHEKLNRLYEKRRTAKELHNSGHGIEGTNSRHQGQHDVPNGNEQREEMEEEDGDSGSESDASVVHIIEPEFQEEPTSSLSRNVASKHTQTNKKATRPGGKPSRSPFLPYGYEAEVKETGKKLTHNIRAAREIYPSALRAQKLRKETAQQHHAQTRRGKVLEKNSQVSNRPVTSEPFRIFIHSDDYDEDSPDWVSEYDRNFQRYSPNEYKKRSNSARVRARELVPQGLSNTQKQSCK